MKRLTQNERERLLDELDRGVITNDEANVSKILTQRVHLVTTPIPREVRKSLMVAVKGGRLGHVRKSPDGPEAFFHPSFEHKVRSARLELARQKLQAKRLILI